MKSEHGSAIVYVFIGIALFGALMFMFSRGTSQNTSAMTDQSNNISASALLEESNILETTAQKLLHDGCSEQELSFDIPPYTANPNTNAPTDKHCHFFHPNGGKLNASAFNQNWVFSSNAFFPNMGTAAPELGAYLGNLDATTCQKINTLVGNGLTTPPSFTGTIYTATYDGTFTASPVSLTPATDISAGCTLSDTHGTAVFFKTLLIR